MFRVQGRRRILVVALLPTLGLAALGVPNAGAACGGVKHVAPSRDLAPGRAPLAIGDSVMLGALGEVARAGYEIDARGCRQISEGLAVLRKRRRAGRLPRLVVVALGTNQPSIALRDIRAALRILGRERVLGLVTARGPGGGAGARAIRAAPRRLGHRVMVLDWVAVSGGHGGWFSGDGIHLSPGGAAALGRLLNRGLRRVYPLMAVPAGMRRSSGPDPSLTGPPGRDRPPSAG